MTKKEAKKVVYNDVLDFIEFTLDNPAWDEYPMEERAQLREQWHLLWERMLKEVPK